MVSRDTKETALLVTAGVAGFFGAVALNAPDIVAGIFLFGLGVVGPIIRDEWRRRQDA